MHIIDAPTLVPARGAFAPRTVALTAPTSRQVSGGWIP
jgi:hypothetical protein